MPNVDLSNSGAGLAVRGKPVGWNESNRYTVEIRPNLDKG